MNTSICSEEVQKGLQQGRSERKPEAYLFRYVEGLSNARTKLKACFNILREVVRHV